MAMTSGSTQAAINVTPLIDVLLVLLIIFMVIVPSTVRGLEALVPEPPNHVVAKASVPPVVVRVFSDEGRGVRYTLNDASLGAAELTPALSRIFAAREDKSMFLEGDARLSYATVAEVIDAARVAGGGEVGIVTGKTKLAQ